MKKFIAIAFAASVALAAPLSVQASTPDTSLLIQVAAHCGPGWHRGPYGRCVRDWVRPVAHCPRGWHAGPHGRCVRGWH